MAEELVREGAYEFLLFSLPDNDFHSHRHGPAGTLDSIGKADAMFARVEPVLKRLPIGQNARVVVRYGKAESNPREVRMPRH